MRIEILAQVELDLCGIEHFAGPYPLLLKSKGLMIFVRSPRKLLTAWCQTVRNVAPKIQRMNSRDNSS